MMSPEAFAYIEVDVPEDFLHVDDFWISMATADVSSRFHRLRISGNICIYFCWLPLSAEQFGISGIDGVPSMGSILVWPMQISFGM